MRVSDDKPVVYPLCAAHICSGRPRTCVGGGKVSGDLWCSLPIALKFEFFAELLPRTAAPYLRAVVPSSPDPMRIALQVLVLRSVTKEHIVLDELHKDVSSLWVVVTKVRTHSH